MPGRSLIKLSTCMAGVHVAGYNALILAFPIIQQRGIHVFHER